MPRERGGSGQYVETVTLEDVLAVFDDVDGPPVVTSGDVADATELSRDSARRKLNELEDRGDVASRRTAGRVLYWRTDWREAQVSAGDRETASEPSGGRDTDGRENGRERRETDAHDDESAAKGDGPATDAGAPEPAGDVDDAVTRAVERVADGWDDAPDRLEARKAAARAVLEHALATGEAVGKSSDAVEAAHDEHPVPQQKYDTWWRKNVKPVLSEVGVYDRGAHSYRVDELDE